MFIKELKEKLKLRNLELLEPTFKPNWSLFHSVRCIQPLATDDNKTEKYFLQHHVSIITTIILKEQKVFFSPSKNVAPNISRIYVQHRKRKQVFKEGKYFQNSGVVL